MAYSGSLLKTTPHTCFKHEDRSRNVRAGEDLNIFCTLHENGQQNPNFKVVRFRLNNDRRRPGKSFFVPVDNVEGV